MVLNSVVGTGNSDYVLPIKNIGSSKKTMEGYIRMLPITVQS